MGIPWTGGAAASVAVRKDLEAAMQFGITGLLEVVPDVDEAAVLKVLSAR